MRQYGGMVSILLLLCLTRWSLGEDVEATEEKDFTLSSESIKMTPFPVRGDGSLLYLTCDEVAEITSDGWNCKLHLANATSPEVVYPLKFSANAKEFDVYNFNLNGTHLYCLVREGSPWGEMHVSGFAHDLASNKTFKLALPSDLIFGYQYIGAFFDDNAVGVVIRNHSVCGSLNQCKLVFNIQGQLIEKPVSYPVNLIGMISYPKVSMDPGLFTFGLIKLYPPTVQAAYFEPNGNPIVLNTFSLILENPRLFSNTAGVYGYCMESEPRKKLKCFQFDWKSKSTLALNFTVDDLGEKDVAFNIVSYANLIGSRFLFIALECGKYKGSECKTARVVTVDSLKNVLKSTPVFKKLKCINGHFMSSVVAEVGDQLCIYIMCNSRHYSFRSAHVHTRCLPKSIV